MGQLTKLVPTLAYGAISPKTDVGVLVSQGTSGQGRQGFRRCAPLQKPGRKRQ